MPLSPENARKKQNRNEQIVREYLETLDPYEVIGKRHGLTRERVRQIVIGSGARIPGRVSQRQTYEPGQWKPRERTEEELDAEDDAC